MAVQVIMPKLGLTMTEGKIVRWLKNEGDPIKKGEPLLEIMTEKIVTEVESPGDGILVKILSFPEEVVQVTDVIAIIAAEGEDVDAMIQEIEAEKPLGEAAPAPAEGVKQQEKAPATVDEAEAVAGRVKASPLARRIARETGIIEKLDSIRGTGPGGRIVKKDVLAYAEKQKTELAVPASTVETRTEPLTALRQAIATRMSASWQTPHFYLETEIDAGPLLEMRVKINEALKRDNLKVTVTDLLVKIVAYVISENRYMNASYTNEGIVYPGEINTGVAVAIDEGLIVPVVKNADKKGIRQISQENRELITKAKENKLGLDDITGGTFTISNLGMFPVDAFTAIINPPEAAILAIGQVVEKPVCVNGEIKIRTCMRITLGLDHRAIDGAQGARFLAALKETLENPLLLSL